MTGRMDPREVVASLTGSEAPTNEQALAANQIAKERHANRTRTRLFRGSIEGRDVLVTIHDPEGYGEVALREGDGRWARWGVPSELHEEA